MYKILFFITVLCAIYCEANFVPIIIWDTSFQIPSQELIRAKRQLFGGVSSFPGGRTNQQFGARGSIFNTPKHDVSAWGSMSQDRWKTGSSPITYGGGVDWTAPRGGLSLSGSHTPQQTSSFTAAGTASIFKTPDHNVNVFGSHTRAYDPNFRPLGSSTTGGLGYQHKSGGSLSLSGTHVPGMPDSGSLTGSVPVYTSKDGNTNLGVHGGVNFGGGQKPSPEVGVKFETRFR
ncbi:Attacin-A [Carabus blaptoides fortunei]